MMVFVIIFYSHRYVYRFTVLVVKISSVLRMRVECRSALSLIMCTLSKL